MKSIKSVRRMKSIKKVFSLVLAVVLTVTLAVFAVGAVRPSDTLDHSWNGASVQPPVTRNGAPYQYITEVFRGNSANKTVTPNTSNFPIMLDGQRVGSVTLGNPNTDGRVTLTEDVTVVVRWQSGPLFAYATLIGTGEYVLPRIRTISGGGNCCRNNNCCNGNGNNGNNGNGNGNGNNGNGNGNGNGNNGNGNGNGNGNNGNGNGNGNNGNGNNGNGNGNGGNGNCCNGNCNCNCNCNCNRNVNININQFNGLWIESVTRNGNVEPVITWEHHVNTREVVTSESAYGEPVIDQLIPFNFRNVDVSNMHEIYGDYFVVYLLKFYSVDLTTTVVTTTITEERWEKFIDGVSAGFFDSGGTALLFDEWVLVDSVSDTHVLEESQTNSANIDLMFFPGGSSIVGASCSRGIADVTGNRLNWLNVAGYPNMIIF